MATCDTVCAAACAAVSLSRPELRGDLESAVEAQSELVLSLLASLSAVLRPLHKLETLLEFEALRREENPLLHTLNGLLTEVRASLAANGVAPLGATVGEFLDEERHERSARGGVSIDDDNLIDDLIVREVVRPGYVHGATGSVLVPVLVHAGRAAVSPAASTPPPTTKSPRSTPGSTPRGGRVHEVQPADTLQGLCLRYGVQQAALLRLNRLPNAQAIHARRTLRLPPATPTGAGDGSPAPTLVAGGSGGGSGSPGCGVARRSSLAGRIAARRQGRRASDGVHSYRGVGQASAGGSDALDSQLVSELEAALRWSLPVEAAPGKAAHKSSGGATPIVFGGSAGADQADGCADWLREHAMHALSEATAGALLQPWRAVGENEALTETASAGEMRFLRSLALHTSEDAVLALLDRDGELLQRAAASIWRCMRELANNGAADALPEAGVRTAAVAPNQAPKSWVQFDTGSNYEELY